MSALAVLRAQARALLPGDCFLRRDQQLRALFVTDFPRRNAALSAGARWQLIQNGFDVMEEKGLWRLDLSREKQQEFICSLPAAPWPAPDESNLPLLSLCRSLLSCGDVVPEHQPWPAVKLSLLRLDAGETALLIDELRALCAVCKRKKTPLPTAVVSLLLSDYSRR